MWALRAILIALVLVLLIAFAFSNNGRDQTVDVNMQPLLANRTGVQVLAVVFWSFVGGVLVSLLLFIGMYIKLSVENHATRRRVKALEHEVAILRNRPIEESVDLLKGADDKGDRIESTFKES